jgi:hypothetical protein
LTAIQRQYGAGKCWAICSRCQLSPTLVLTKISRGVLVSTRVGLPRAMTIPWMSGSASPPATRSQVSPPSRLRCTPSISTPAHTVRESSGSTTVAVTRGVPIAHSFAKSRGSCSQCWPPSRDRYTAEGLVPAKMVSGLDGSMARDQMFRLASGPLTRSQLAPLSRLRYTPLSAPAKSVCASVGCSASARTRLSKGKGWRILCQVSPPSGLCHRPCPTVPMQMV